MFPKYGGATLCPVYKGTSHFSEGFLRLEIPDNSRARKKKTLYLAKNSLGRSIYPHLQGADSVRVRGNLRKTIDFRRESTRLK